jgi:hypothetical protein
MDSEALLMTDGLPEAYVRTIGVPEGLFLSSQDYRTISIILSTAAADGVDMRDVCMSLPILATPADSWDLVKLIQRAFEGASIPEGVNLEDQAVSLWYRRTTTKAGCLFKTLEPVTRTFKGRSFLWAAPLISIWPPPIVLNTTRNSAVVWTFELADEDRELPAIRTIGNYLAEKYMGYFFAAVCYDPTSLSPLSDLN